MSEINYSIRWYAVHRGRIDSAAVYRELACCCFGGWVREGMQVGGHSEHGTGQQTEQERVILVISLT